ncbi:hypothetical protein CCPUN_06230 [Cardinium endosymbiont of Culicoides punctatus]|nr:hypothetical protein CCPUN_06230 [Cardinium endosymbiont of Culicoides punctatus]
MEEIAKGNKELFQDSYIYNSGYDWKKYPVIRVDFGGKGNITPDNLLLYLEDKLKDVASDYKLTVTGDTFQSRLENLVKNMTDLNDYANKIVVLIDEYDAPFINQLDPVIKESNRLIVRDFLTEIKSLTANNFIKLEFVTGVSSYCFRDTYSGPNNLNDITLSPDYTTVAGYKEEDLLNKDSVYYKRINQLAEKRNISRDILVGEMRSMYNGYKFHPEDDTIAVYNPLSTLMFLQSGELNNYWINTGTPTFLVKKVSKSNVKDFSKPISVTKYELIEPDEDSLTVDGAMFQGGYLTIDKYENSLDDGKLRQMDDPILLKFPNGEVEKSFYNLLFKKFEKDLESEGEYQEDDVIKALSDVDIDGFISILASSFASIPYNAYYQQQNRNEAFYHAVLHAFLRGARMHPESEKCSNLGRIDIVINSIPNLTYIFELKHGKNADTALEQAQNAKYIQQYIRQNKDIVIIGINFGSDYRNLDDYEYKLYDSGGNEIVDRDAFLDHITKRKKVRYRSSRKHE